MSFASCAIDGSPISDFDWNQISMVDPTSGDTLATTSALDASGSLFSVTDGSVTTPTTTVSGAGSAWHRSQVALDFTATDAGGPGVSYTEYSMDGGVSWTQGTSLIILAPKDHTNDGIHTILYSSTDTNSIAEPIKSCQVKIDTKGLCVPPRTLR